MRVNDVFTAVDPTHTGPFSHDGWSIVVRTNCNQQPRFESATSALPAQKSVQSAGSHGSFACCFQRSCMFLALMMDSNPSWQQFVKKRMLELQQWLDGVCRISTLTLSNEFRGFVDQSLTGSSPTTRRYCLYRSSLHCFSSGLYRFDHEADSKDRHRCVDRVNVIGAVRIDWLLLCTPRKAVCMMHALSCLALLLHVVCFLSCVRNLNRISTESISFASTSEQHTTRESKADRDNDTGNLEDSVSRVTQDERYSLRQYGYKLAVDVGRLG